MMILCSQNITDSEQARAAITSAARDQTGKYEYIKVLEPHFRAILMSHDKNVFGRMNDLLRDKIAIHHKSPALENIRLIL